MATASSKVELIKKHIKNYPDFPKAGILFRDIFGVTANPDAAQALYDVLNEYSSKLKGKVQAVCGLESRGFLFGPQIAINLKVPFIPIRKPGKLPGEVQSVSYELEYGTDKLEIQKTPIMQGAKVLIVDDVLATGGTMSGACQLVKSVGGQVFECLVIIELVELNGRKKIAEPLHTIIKL